MPSERFTGLAAVLDAIRGEEGITQPVVGERVGLGRSVVAQRIAELEAAGLVVQDGVGPSTGGRAPRRLRLRAEAGHVLGVDIASNELFVGVADLAGNLRATRHEEIDVTDGPEVVLARVEHLGDAVLEQAGARGGVWAVGAGLPGPVAFDTGVPARTPVLPGWDGQPVRERLAARWSAPAWIDNRVNLLALGEIWSNPTAAAAPHMLYLGAGASIAAALVSNGCLYRGAHGLAGAIGHVAVPEAGVAVCRCGNVGCLEAVAGGAALAQSGRLLAETGQSPHLAAVLARTGAVRPLDITLAAEDGDPAARALLERTATLLGGSLATLVSVLDPDLVVLGGGIARAGAHVLTPVREAVRRRSLAPSTDDLRIEISAVDEEVAGVTGAAQLALGEVFSRGHLPGLLESLPATPAAGSRTAGPSSGVSIPA